jgi:hypothetical protein
MGTVDSSELQPWVVPMPQDVSPTHAMRGTVMINERAQLRAAGHFDLYAGRLSEPDRASLAAVVGQFWVPIDLVHAHFEAVDALNIPDADAYALSRTAGQKLHNVFVALGASFLQATGMNPWTAMPVFAKAWDRNFQGGAMGVQQMGPKEAHIVITSHPLIRHRFHRIGLRAHAAIYIELLATGADVSELSADADAGTMTLAARWT